MATEHIDSKEMNKEEYLKYKLDMFREEVKGMRDKELKEEIGSLNNLIRYLDVDSDKEKNIENVMDKKRKFIETTKQRRDTMKEFSETDFVRQCDFEVYIENKEGEQLFPTYAIENVHPLSNMVINELYINIRGLYNDKWNTLEMIDYLDEHSEENKFNVRIVIYKKELDVLYEEKFYNCKMKRIYKSELNYKNEDVYTENVQIIYENKEKIYR